MNKNKEFISPDYVLQSNANKVIINKIEGRRRIYINEKPNQVWFNKKQVYQKYLGFFFNGIDKNNLLQIPCKTFNELTHGSYSELDNHGAFSKVGFCDPNQENAYSNGYIDLNYDLPSDILCNIKLKTSVLSNQYSGGTFNYFVLEGDEIDTNNEWKEFSNEITGEAIGNIANKFRPTTEYVNIIILANYGQGIEFQSLYKDIVFESFEIISTFN